MSSVSAPAPADPLGRTAPVSGPRRSAEPRRSSESRRFGHRATGFTAVGVAATGLPWLLPQLRAVDRLVFEVLGFGLFFVFTQLALLTAGVALLANGFVVVRREGIGVATVVAPAVGLGLLVLSMAIRDVARPADDAPAALSACAGVIVILGGFLMLQLLTFLGYTLACARRPRRADNAAIVVLGCGLDGARVTPLLAARLDRAIGAYRRDIAAGADPLIVTSGGQGPDEAVPEADAMADYLVAAGIPAECIVRERASRTTEENLRYSEIALREHGLNPADAPITVVTSDFHVPRAALLCRRVRLGTRVIGGRTASYFLLTAYLREFVAFLNLHRRPNLVIGSMLISSALVGYLSITP
ncbi:MAG: YdcF family protein [Nocardia sp.]|nr:YdcF family protein [Nocardia sp.]